MPPRKKSSTVTIKQVIDVDELMSINAIMKAI